MTFPRERLQLRLARLPHQDTVVLHLQFLGGFHATDNGRAIAALQSERMQFLLAYVLLHRHTPLSRQQVAFTFWPDTTDAQARHNLRTLLTRLREALPEMDQILAIDAQNIQWRSDAPCTSDIGEFEQALACGNVRRASELYRGDLLPTCYADWIANDRERYRVRYIEALAQAVTEAEAQHDFVNALHYAQRTLEADPLREETYCQLMRLHARTGDRVSVRRVFKTCELILQRELGVGPNHATRELYRQLLAAETAPSPIDSPARSARHNLRQPLTSFIGRTHELATVKHLLRTTRLLTMAGVGGSGKTRLALHVAFDTLADYADGVWWVDFASIAQPSLVVSTVAATLDVKDAAGQSLLETLTYALQSRHLLLVLDNCEHLISECAVLIRRLLEACPHLTILATSRETINISGEQVWRVPPLHLAMSSELADIEQAEAVQLFAARAMMAWPAFALTQQNATVIAQICRRLDGLPLAIELAAARIKLLSVEQIAAQLADRFSLLTTNDRAMLPRHQTLRATIDWSYQLLDETESTLLRALAVFAGGFTIEAAEAVSGSPNVLDLLARLVDKSLVVVDAERESEGVRYRLLETISEYAHQELTRTGDEQAAHTRHLHFYLKLAEQMESSLEGAHQLQSLDRLEVEHDNLRAALDFALRHDPEQALKLVGALWLFWFLHGYFDEGRNAVGQAVSVSAATMVSAVARAKALCAAASFALFQADYATAQHLSDESLALSRAVGYTRGILVSLHHLGGTALSEGLYQRAVELLNEGLVLARQAGDSWSTSTLLEDLANVALSLGDLAQASTLIEEALDLDRARGDQWMVGFALANLADTAQLQGDYVRAQMLIEEGIRYWQQVKDKHGLSGGLQLLGAVAQRQGDYVRAAEALAEALRLLQQLGEKEYLAGCLDEFARLASATGETHRAVRLFAATEAIRTRVGNVLAPSHRADWKRDVTLLRAKLGDSVFSALWQTGQAMTMDQTIAYALQDNPQ